MEQSKGKLSPEIIGYVNEKTIGIVKKLNKLITEVSEIDRATSPSANLEIIFVVTPPGAAASNIKPTFNSKGIGKTNAKVRANIGKRISCEQLQQKNLLVV